MTIPTETTIDSTTEAQTFFDLATAYYNPEIIAKYVADCELNSANIVEKEESIVEDFNKTQVPVLEALAAEKGITPSATDFDSAKALFFSQVVKAVEPLEVTALEQTDSDIEEVASEDSTVVAEDTASDIETIEVADQGSIETVADELVIPTTSTDVEA